MAIKRRKIKDNDGNVISVSWSYDFYDIFKKRHQKSGFKTKPEAERAEAKARNEYNMSKNFYNNKNIMFREVLDKFQELYADVNLKPSTAKGYKGYFSKHIKPYFGSIKLIDVNPIILQKFIKTKDEEGLSPKTINHLLTTIGTVFNWAIDCGYSTFNPTQRIKRLKVAKIEMKYLELNEIEAVLKEAKENYPDFYPLLLTAIYSGMRRGEILGLAWDYVNFKDNKIKVVHSLYKGKLYEPKTGYSKREIQMPPLVMQELKEWKKYCPENELNLVFPDETGNFMDADNMIKRRFNKVLENAEVKKIRFHDLRHTYASLLLAKDVNIKYIQRQMGHSSFEITMNTYAHLMPEVYEKSKLLINGLI
jgi:integrase